jgi:putative DNA primase/helicase
MNPTASNPIPQFPASLKALQIWCVWRYEERDGKQTKVPYRPLKLADGTYIPAPAQSNNPETWASFEDACAAVCDQSEFQLGIFADGSHTFIDLDRCVGAEGPEAWALGVLARTNSYAELSPSGTGLHIFVRGTVSKASKINGCECYSTARFFTVTGKHLELTSLVVNPMTAADLEELRDDIAQDQLRPYKLNKHTTATPTAGGLIVHKPLSANEREAKLERALSGDLSEYGEDRSAAVYGALQLLAR